MEVIADLWQQEGYKHLGNWIDGAIAVILLGGGYYYKKWVDHKFENKK